MALALAEDAEISEARNPPAANDAEMAVLGAVLIKPLCFAEVKALLMVDDFFFVAHCAIYEAMLEVDRSGRPMDVLAIQDEIQRRGEMGRLEDGGGYLLRCANSVPTGENVTFHCRLVAEKATLRRLIAQCAETASRAYGGADPAELIDEQAAALLRLGHRSTRDLVPIHDLVEQTVKGIEDRQVAGNPVTGIPTGIDILDKTLGGLKAGKHIVLAARPSVGKTALAINFALHNVLKCGGAALIFSLEMEDYELVERMISLRGGVDSNDITRGTVSQFGWMEINRATTELADARVYVVDDPDISMSQIEALSLRFAAKYPTPEGGRPLGMVVGDYFQLLNVKAARGQSREQALADVSGRWKRLAKRIRMPVLNISQLSRKCEDENRAPRMPDLRETGSLEQDADVVMFIDDPARRRTQKSKLDPPPTKTIDGPLQIIVDKNRGGMTGRFPVRWVAKFYSFTDWAGADEPWEDTQ